MPTDPEHRRYSEEQVQAMAEVLKKNQFIGKRITYPVRAILVGEAQPSQLIQFFNELSAEEL